MAYKLSKSRYIQVPCEQDLKEKLVFIGGPRQVGKTTLALQMLKVTKGVDHPAYLNWDIEEHRQQILKNEIPSNQKLIVFDEIHKYTRWRNLPERIFRSLLS